MRKILTALTCAVALACGGCFSPPEPPPDKKPSETHITAFDNSSSSFAERLGATYWGGRYMPGEYDGYSLSAAAVYLKEMGTKVIKIACGDPVTQYPLDDFSGETFGSGADILKHAAFKAVLDDEFVTYYISFKERKSVKWTDGLSETERAYVEQEFYDAAGYLLNAYKGSGKVFVLQNWESDNYLAMNRTEAQMALYAEYVNARQDGINRAASEFVMSEAHNVYVFGALEVNFLNEKNFLRAVDAVVPRTYCDLYTYSSYETKDKGSFSSADGIKRRMVYLLSAYKSSLPDEDSYPQPMYFGDRRLAITEFGYPDSADGYTGEWQQTVAEGHLRAGQAMKVQHMIYWQLCDNEIIGANRDELSALKGEALKAHIFVPGELNGFYLIRPDGVKTYTFNYFKKIIETDSLAVTAELPDPWKS